MQFMAEEPNTVHGCKHVIIMVRKASSRRRLVLLRCGGRHRRARAGNRSGREGNRGGGREIDGQVEKSTARSSIWPFGERERTREERGTSAPGARGGGDSSAPSASRARILCVVLSASTTPPAGPQAAPAAGPQAPPSSCLCICCLVHAFMLLSC